MKSLIKITALTIIAMLVIIGSLTAQDKTESCKSEKKSSSACCSSKEANAKMGNKKMDHNKMSDINSIDKNKDGKVFQCPMKCEVPQDESGECSKCGMDLKEVSIKDSKHKMMEHRKMNHVPMNKDEKVDFVLIDKDKDGYIYECPMKCELPKDQKGECSKCGMNLKKKKVK